MKYVMFVPVLALLPLIPGDSSGFGRGGGGGGRGGGGGARPAAPVHTPAMHAPAARPNPAPVARPNPAPVARPNPAPVNRPAAKPAFVPQNNPALRPNPLPARPPINSGGGIKPPANIGGGSINNRPNVGVGNRPNVGNSINNRPNIGINNRPAIGSNNNVNVNRAVNVNQNNLVNNRINVNRPNGVYRPGYSHYHGNYNNWHHGYWNNWNYKPWLWGGVGLTTGLLLGSASPAVVYSNPYYDAPPANVTQVFDYSQPIPVPQPVEIAAATPDDFDGTPVPAPEPSEPPVDEISAAAAKLLDDARVAFKKNDYATAQQTVEKAIALLPGDTTLHEFRALTLFAQKQYREAAAGVHAVLAVGPGWDWDTMKELYPDAATYTAQLRALEGYCTANPMAASARFLLAYHYLVLDARDAAVKTLKSVVALLPTDELAAYLLKSLEPQDETGRPTPAM